MRMPRWAALTTGAVIATGLVLAGSPAAQAHPGGGGDDTQGRHHAATIKKAIHDKNRFDHKGNDFDILDAALKAVITADPSSPLTVLGDKTTALTAFLPTDLAFLKFVKDLTGSWPESEKAAFEALAALGTDAVESLLLYHVVLGDPLSKKELLAADGTTLVTANGATIGVSVEAKKAWHKSRHVHRWHNANGWHKVVHVHKHRCVHSLVTLIDNDPDARDAKVLFSKHHRPRHHYGEQIAYVVTSVLRPVDVV